MDAKRFDRLAQTFGQPRSRRSLTRLLGGMGLGGVFSLWGTTETLAARRNAGAPCTRNRQCKTGKCVGEPGKRVCSCSNRYACPGVGQCLHGGCFRSESCGAECTIGTICGNGPTGDCYCSQTSGGTAAVCYQSKIDPCTPTCDANSDCPLGRACIDVSCIACNPQVAAICLGPCLESE